MSDWTGTGTAVTTFTGGGSGIYTLQDIVDMIRYRLNNYEPPYLWLDNELVYYTNQIFNMLCLEGRILEDSFTQSVCQFSTVSGIADYLLHSSIIYIKSAKISTQETLSLNVAPSVSWAAGDTLTGASSGKTCVVVAKLTNYTYTVKQRTGAFTLGEVISNGTYTADQGAAYPVFTDSTTNTNFLSKYSTIEMNRYYPSWRAQPGAQPLRYLLDCNTGYITLYPTPNDIFIVNMSVIRYPLTQLSSTNMTFQVPELNPKYVNALVEGVCYMAYQKRGDDTYDPNKSSSHYAQFRKELGMMKIQNNLNESNQATASPVGGFI